MGPAFAIRGMKKARHITIHIIFAYYKYYINLYQMPWNCRYRIPKF